MSELRNSYAQITVPGKKSSVLFNNANADGDSPAIIPNGTQAIAIIRGDSFAGVTVTFQARSANDPSARWRNMTDGQFTEAAEVPLEKLPADMLIRAQLAGTTSGNNIFVEVVQ